MKNTNLMQGKDFRENNHEIRIFSERQDGKIVHERTVSLEHQSKALEYTFLKLLCIIRSNRRNKSVWIS